MAHLLTITPGPVRPYEVIEENPLSNWSLEECIAYASKIKARMSFWNESTYSHNKCTIHVTPAPAASITIRDLANKILFQDPLQPFEDLSLISLKADRGILPYPPWDPSLGLGDPFFGLGDPSLGLDALFTDSSFEPDSLFQMLSEQLEPSNTNGEGVK